MWIVFALLAAFLAAIVTTLSKAGLKDVNPSLAFAIQSVLILVVSWTVVLIQGRLPEMKNVEGRAWIYLVAAGVITTFSSLFLFRALKLGEAAQVNPIDRLSLVFAIIFAAVFLKEKITWQIVVGGALMAAGAIVIALAKKTS